MVVNTRWGGLRVEPYKANPKDADLDQIVQEGTIWERPATTFIADAFGELIPDGLVGQTLEDRAGLSIVDANGNDVDYTPSWAQQPLSLAERQRTIGQTLGTIGDARRTIGKREGNLVEGPTIDPDKTEALDLLEDADLDDYIKRLSRLERRGRIGKDDAEWLAAARSLREDRDRKKAPDEVDTSTVINPPNGWGETPESVQANKQSDNLQEPNVSVSDVEEAVDGFDWKKAKEERDNLAEGRLKRLYENVWAEQYINSDENPWDLPVPEDEDGLPIDQDFDEVDQLWNALTEEQQNEWLEKMFLVGEEIELGYVVVDGNRYRLTATHELSDDGIERDIDTGNPDIMGRWNFKVYDGFGNEVYNSNEGPNPTDFGDHKNGGTARSLLVNEKMMIMNYLGTDHTAEFFDNDGNPVEIEFSGLDESLAQIFNDNAFMFATQIGIEKAGLEASSKGQVVWAAQGYDPVKNSYSTIQNLMTTTKLLDSWEQVEALRAAGDLDVENNVEHAKLVLAASVLGSRERYLKVKGMLSGVDTSKLPADTGDLMNTIFSEADVDRILAEAGTSFDEIPKGGDLLHAILPEGKLRNNVLAFNMWSGSEGARGLSPAERRAAISQVENADELTAAMNTIIRNEGEDITGGIAVWKQLDEPVMPLISASAEQDLKKYTPPERSSLLSRKIVASRRPSKPDPSGNDSRTGVDAFTYGAEVAGDSDELLDGFANSVNEAIDVYTDEPTILEMTGGLQSIMNQDLREDPLEKLAEALNTGKSQGRIRGEYEVVDGRLIRTSRLYPDEKEDVTEAAEFLIGKTREYQVTTEKAQQLVEDPVNSAEGFSGSVAVLVDSGQQAAITTAGIEGLDGIIVSVTQGEDGERTLVSWKPLDAADEIYLGQGMGGFMSCRPIIEGTENVKQVQINTKRLEQIRQDLLADGWSEEEANQMMAFTTLTLINHELLHVWDYQKDDSINRGVWLGQYQPASTIALQAFIMDNITPDMLTEEQKESGQNYRVLLESGVLTDENIRKIADPKQRKQMEALKAIYDTQTMKDMIMSPEEMGFTPEEVEDYWANADEVVARAAQSVLFQETLKKNGLGDFLPQREIELWEAVERELGADAAELLWAVESPFADYIEDDLTPEQLAYYKQVVEPWYLAQQKALNDAPAEISDAFKGYKLDILRYQRDKNGNYIRGGMPRRRSTDQQKHYEFSPHEVEAMAPEVFKFLDTLDVLEPNFKYEGRDVPAESLELRGNELPPVRVDLDLASSRENLEARISRLGSRLADRGPATSQTSDSRRIRQERSVSTVLTDILRPRPKREVDTSAVKESVVLDISTSGVLSNRDSEAAYEVVSAVQSADAFIEDGVKVGVVSRSIPEEETAQGMYDADGHTIILSDGVTKANASSTLVHELGHAYDYEKGTSKIAAAESTITESAVYKNLEAKYIGEPESQLDAIDNRVTNYTPVTVKKSEIAAVLGEEQGTLFAFVRKQLGDENASDEKVFDAIFGSDFFDSSDELTLDASNDLVAKSLGMMGFNDADEHVRFLQTLENVSDDEFEELLQDLPFAAQSRAIYLRGLTTSDKFKTIQKYDKEQSSYSLLASGQGQKVLKEALTKEIQLWVDGKESERVQNVSELVGKVEERLDAEFVAMRYTMRSEELWGFGYQQGLQFNRISELAGSDENGKDIIRIMQDAGVMDEFSSELAQLKKDNPELYQAVETYIENFAASVNPTANYYYVQDLDEVQNLRDNLVNVINDDGNGALPNAPSYDKASVRINREDRGKLIERFYDNEDQSALSEQELIEAIPDGKLDIYIDAFENHNEVEGELDQDEIDDILFMREELAQKIRAEKQRRATSDFYSDPVLSTTRRSDEDRPAFSRDAGPSGPPPSGPPPSGPPPAPDEPEITPPPQRLPFDASLNRRAQEVDMTLTPELREQWDAERQRLIDLDIDPEMQERRMQQVFDELVRDNPDLVRTPPPSSRPLGGDPDPLPGTFAYNESLGLPPPNFDIDEPDPTPPPPRPIFEEEDIPVRGQRRADRLYDIGLTTDGDDISDITRTDTDRRRRGFVDDISYSNDAPQPERNTDDWLEDTEWYGESGAILPDTATFMSWVESENVRDARDNSSVVLNQVEQGNPNSPLVDLAFTSRTDNSFNNLNEFPDKRYWNAMTDSELENYMVTLEWTLSDMEKNDLDEIPRAVFSSNPISKDELAENVMELRAYYSSRQLGNERTRSLNPRYRRDRRDSGLEPFKNDAGSNMGSLWERDRRIIGGDRRDANDRTTREIFEQRRGPELQGPRASRSAPTSGGPPSGGPPPSREAARARQRRARVPVDRTDEPFTESGSRLQDSPLQENGIYISQEAPGLFTVSYGDLETEIVIEDSYGESFAEGDGYIDWAMWEGNYRLRNIAANLMGHAPPRAGGSEVAAMTSNTEDRILNTIIATGELQEAGLSDEQLQNIGRLVLNARKGIRDINFADEDAPDLYRGIEAPDGSEILDLEAGDSFVLTLSAFSPSENMASGFAGLPFGSEVWTPESGREKPEFDEGSKPVVFKLKQGSKAIAPPADDWSMQDDMDEGLSIEYITQGEFVISDVRDRGDGVRIIEIEQIATYGDYGLDRNPSVTPQRYDEITKGPRVEEGPEGIKTMKANPIQELADKHGEKRNWESVTAIDPDRRVSIADAYEQAEEVTPENMTEEARESFEALGSEIEEQFDMVTKPVSEGGLGITVEFVDEDPYDNFIEMYEDYTENKTIKILKTEATGGHPFFTNEQNDKFRAVHDLFGHLATGRGFDRHGEEAAYQAHKSMFSETAAKAAATELRGQNSYLLEKGDFGPQKLILLPESMRKGLAGWFTMLTKVAGMQPAQSDADADNLFELSNSHHVSCGRILQKD